MKKLLTLVGAYAAGLAVAMKLRKDKGTSKLEKNPKKITAGNVVDEIVDIHKVLYADVKNFLTPLFEDIDNVDDLKVKVSEVVDGFSSKMNELFAELKAK